MFRMDLPHRSPFTAMPPLRPRRLIAMLLTASLLMFIPKLIHYRESTRMADSQAFLESVRAAQETYRQSHGRYAPSLAELDLSRPEPTYFAVGSLRPGKSGDSSTSWSLTLTRFGEAFLYGPYQISFDDQGFDSAASSLCPLPSSTQTSRNQVAGLFTGSCP
jgi:type II secretory pathway pseudopilin PulG